jgi:hypothetical protein
MSATQAEEPTSANSVVNRRLYERTGKRSNTISPGGADLKKQVDLLWATLGEGGSCLCWPPSTGQLSSPWTVTTPFFCPTIFSPLELMEALFRKKQ